MKDVLEWYVNEGLVANKYECPACKKDMHLLVEHKNESDGYEKGANTSSLILQEIDIKSDTTIADWRTF